MRMFFFVVISRPRVFYFRCGSCQPLKLAYEQQNIVAKCRKRLNRAISGGAGAGRGGKKAKQVCNFDPRRTIE